MYPIPGATLKAAEAARKQHLTAPQSARVYKDERFWFEGGTIAASFSKEKDGQTYFCVDVTVNGNGTGLNVGSLLTTEYRVHWDAMNTGKPENLATMTRIALQGIKSLLTACGVPSDMEGGYPVDTLTTCFPSVESFPGPVKSPLVGMPIYFEVRKRLYKGKEYDNMNTVLPGSK